MIQRSKKVSNRLRLRLYNWIFVDYECVKNNYKLIAVDSSRRRQLDVDAKAIQQIEYVS